MAIDLSTAGIHLKYAVEATKGTRPTTGYTDLPGVKTIPNMNPSPDTLETTDLNEVEWKTYIQGLKDLGGNLEFTFNLNQEIVTIWEALVEAYTTAAASDKATWFLIDIPGLTDGFYFPGQPAEMGIPEAAVNSVLEITNYITTTGAPVKAAKPTGE